MEKEKLWFKFILSGRAEDYIEYSNARIEEESKVNGNSIHNRCVGDRSKEYWG